MAVHHEDEGSEEEEGHGALSSSSLLQEAAPGRGPRGPWHGSGLMGCKSKWDNPRIYLKGSLRGINKLIHLKCLHCYLPGNDCSADVWYLFLGTQAADG